MDPPLLLLQDISLSFGTTPLLDGATLSVSAGERLCLVGRNGSGKSTLLKIAAGLLTPDRGTRFLQPGTTIRYLPQEPDLTGYATTLAFVEAGLGPGDDIYRATYLLECLGLDGTEDPTRLSGGEARRCALARTLAPSPDILLLDEPTNHLDLPAIAWLEEELAGLRTGVVLISHDRRLLESLSRGMVWLDRGTTRRRDQGFSQFEAWRDETLEQEARDSHKLGRKIAMEEDWLRYGVTARRKRNQGRLALLQGLRQQHRELVGATGRAKLAAAADGRVSGRLVVVADEIGKTLGGREVVRDFTTRILRGDRVGIVGRNGAGKTTLLRMLTGALPPDQGEVRIGAGLEQVTLDQRRDSLDPTRTLADTLTGGGDTVLVNGERRHVMSYMKDFLFAPEQARTPVGMLSGGERGRLTLACALAKPSNLLVLDEPTNDLDLETLELLQELLSDYPGTVLLVSHDRDFLDRVATSVIASEGDGIWVDYAGGYSDMLAQRRPAAIAPPAGRATSVRGAREKAATPRLSFKDRHALLSLPDRIEALAAQRRALSLKLADADLYRRDPAGFRVATEQLAETDRLAAEAEERWLELEMKREALEG